jgi:hypothetical protein
VRHGGLFHRLGRAGTEPGRVCPGRVRTACPRLRFGRARRGPAHGAGAARWRDIAVDATRRRSARGRQGVPPAVLRPGLHGRRPVPGAGSVGSGPQGPGRHIGYGEAGDVPAVRCGGPVARGRGVAVARTGVAVGHRMPWRIAAVDRPRGGRQPNGRIGRTGRPRNSGLDPAGRRIASAVPRRLGPPVVGELGEGHAHEGYAVPRAAVRTPKGSRASP